MSSFARDVSGGNDSDDGDERISIMASKSIHAGDHNAKAESFLAADATFGCAEGEDECIVMALISRENSPAFSEGGGEGIESSHTELEPSEQLQALIASAIVPVTVNIGGADDPLAAPPTAPGTMFTPPKLTGMAALHAGHRANIFDSEAHGSPTGSHLTRSPENSVKLERAQVERVAAPVPDEASVSWLLSGEKMTLTLCDAAASHWCNPHVPGTFYMTTYRVRFIPEPAHQVGLLQRFPSALSFFDIPLTCIDRIEPGNQRKPVRDTKGQGTGLGFTLHCKDARVVTFTLIARAGSAARPQSLLAGSSDPNHPSNIAALAAAKLEQVNTGPKHTMEEVASAYKVISAYAFPNSIKYVFAFAHRAVVPEIGGPTNVPESAPFDMCEEWRRMGITNGNPLVPVGDSDDEADKHVAVKCPFRLSAANSKYDLCSSYPKLLVVPQSVTDIELKQVAQFRSGQRLMGMSWRDASTNVTLWRSSQPKAGISGSNIRDEKYLDLIAKSVMYYKSPILHIVDCRPKTAALANRAAGAGYENKSNYPNTRLEFYNIGNIHTMRDSFARLSALHINAQMNHAKASDWSKLVEDTGWLGHVRLVLKCSHDCVKQITSGVPVLVHCSHGWDRTSQVCALASLMLDPYFRTFRGFQVLVEKEWCGFGHPFQLRCAHGEDKTRRNDDQLSPIFLQFLDCCVQLCNQYPLLFEFTPRYLLTIASHVHSCRFSTFILSCDHDRELLLVDNKCTGIWSYLATNFDVLRNPFFDPANGSALADPSKAPPATRCPHLLSNGALLPPLNLLLSKVRLWSDFFERWAGSEVQQIAPSHYFSALLVDGLAGQVMRPLALEGAGTEAALTRAIDGTSTSTSTSTAPPPAAAPEGEAEDTGRQEAADAALLPVVTANDFWESAFRRERCSRLTLEARVKELEANLNIVNTEAMLRG